MMDNWQEAWEQYAGKVMERLGWLGASLVLFGYYLNANQYISSWLVWVVFFPFVIALGCSWLLRLTRPGPSLPA